MSQELPTTAYSTILSDGNYLWVDKMGFSKYNTMYNWLDMIWYSNNVQINNKLNYNGKEKRVGPYLVDGYDPKNNMIYEFHGCYFHGHDPANCSITRKISCEK